MVFDFQFDFLVYRNIDEMMEALKNEEIKGKRNSLLFKWDLDMKNEYFNFQVLPIISEEISM